MHASPPVSTEIVVVVRAATAPASTLPSSSPPRTLAQAMPPIRPRMSSGITVAQIALRNTTLTRSAQPARPTSTSATHNGAGTAKTRDGGTPRHTASTIGEPVTVDAAGPARRHRPEERPTDGAA